MWAYARESSAKEQMRLCYENIKADTIVWNNTTLSERFSAERMYEQFVSYIYKPPKDLEDWNKKLMSMGSL
jgi:hypothetical protein